MRLSVLMRLVGTVLAVVLFAGCLGGSAPKTVPEAVDAVPFLGYKPSAPDLGLKLLEFDEFLAGDGVEIHARVVRPDGPGPFPVVAQFTPYTAPGRNAALQGSIEPPVGGTPFGRPADTFVTSFVRRGYAFAYADVRGTGDSTGCLDLRGPRDIADVGKLTDYLGTRPWSSGKVGFIGASYPGSEAHMAAIANSPYLAAVVPVVASTSFYHYHHNDGVPYAGQHSLGGTNTGYTQNAIMPTLNPQSPNYLPRYAQEVSCPYKENMVDHGGWDQTGAYYPWWQERNLRARSPEVRVPVLMAQGLADWNVKPDHIATWFNDLDVQKTLIAGQWPHQYPRSPCKPEQDPATCDDTVPYGNWWEYVTAFFDTHLKGVDTGMFRDDVAWVQDNAGRWHRSAEWPLREANRETLTLHFGAHRDLRSEPVDYEMTYEWYGCPEDQFNRGVDELADVERATVKCIGSEIVLRSQPFAQDTLVSGVPLVHMRLSSEARSTHVVAILTRVGPDGAVQQARENYGYLNPVFRNGLDKPEPLPSGPYDVVLDLYPQEDLVRAGDVLELRLRSDDEDRTIEAFAAGTNVVHLGPGIVNALELPVRPLGLQGTRLA